VTTAGTPGLAGVAVGTARNKEALPFMAGRAYARGLKLKGERRWMEWSKSGQRSPNIPACPNQTYRNDGWVSMPEKKTE